MIAGLEIKNIAIIRNLSVRLKSGLNILSGETGAGKSIIIDSINFVLGDRADRSLIRHGESNARVELIFENIKNFAEIKRILDLCGIDCNSGQIIVTRSMTSERSECRINGRIVTLTVLRSIVGNLVDINSQNEHRALSRSGNHINYLDAFQPEIAKIRADYIVKYHRYRNVCSELRNLSTAEERDQRTDILKYQIEEIERANWVREEEEEEIICARSKHYNTQKIRSNVNSAVNGLDSESASGLFFIKSAMLDLHSVLKFDEELLEIYDRLESVAIEIGDIVAGLKEKLSETNEKPDIDYLEKRLNEIRNLKRKYGIDVKSVMEFYEAAKNELAELEEAGIKAEKLEKEKLFYEEELTSEARKLHKLREEAAAIFASRIRQNLDELGMKNCKFAVSVDLADDILYDLRENGADAVEFLLSPNPGEPLKPLSKIASGGETSRIMLALKNILSEVDKVDALIFDEIDTGISGRIAKVVARKLYDIACKRQVIAITHLPQIASMGDANYLVEKNSGEDATSTSIVELNERETLAEITRLMGLAEDSETGTAGAKELKEWANSYKSNINP